MQVIAGVNGLLRSALACGLIEPSLISTRLGAISVVWASNHDCYVSAAVSDDTGYCLTIMQQGKAPVVRLVSGMEATGELVLAALAQR